MSCSGSQRHNQVKLCHRLRTEIWIQYVDLKVIKNAGVLVGLVGSNPGKLKLSLYNHYWNHSDGQYCQKCFTDDIKLLVILIFLHSPSRRRAVECLNHNCTYIYPRSYKVIRLRYTVSLITYEFLNS